MFLLQVDDNGNAIQVLQPKPGSSLNVTVGATSQAVALPTNAKVIQLTCMANIRARLGTIAVVALAADTLYLAGMHILAVNGYTHLGIIQDTAGGNVNLTELQ